MLPWPRDALLSVANMYLEDMKYPNITQQLKDQLATMFVKTKESLDEANLKFYSQTKRHVYSTSKS